MFDLESPLFLQFRLRAFQKTSAKRTGKLGILAVIVISALTIGLCVGLWPCEKGLSGHGVGNCEDIDECKVGIFNHSQKESSFLLWISLCEEQTHNCHEDAKCINTVGFFKCECKAGHKGSGMQCADVDECSTGSSF